MPDEIEDRALALLRADGELAVPLSRLYHAVAAEAPDVGGVAQFRERLRRRPDLFQILEPRSAPWDAEAWPGEVRQEYQAALREAGLEAEPRVASAEPLPADPAAADGTAALLRRLQATLIELWRQAGADPDARTHLTEAMRQLRELRSALRPAEAATPVHGAPPGGRPTTPPPGLRSRE